MLKHVIYLHPLLPSFIHFKNHAQILQYSASKVMISLPNAEKCAGIIQNKVKIICKQHLLDIIQ